MISLVIPFLHLTERGSEEVKPEIQQPETVVEQYKTESRTVFSYSQNFKNPHADIPFRCSLPYYFGKYIFNLIMSIKAMTTYSIDYELYITHALKHIVPIDILNESGEIYFIFDTEEFEYYINTTYQNQSNFIGAVIFDYLYSVTSHFLNLEFASVQDYDGYAKVHVVSSNPNIVFQKENLFSAYVAYPIKLIPINFSMKLTDTSKNYLFEFKAMVEKDVDRRVLSS